MADKLTPGQAMSVSLGEVRQDLGNALSPWLRDELMALENKIAETPDLFPRFVLVKRWARRLHDGLTP